ncbi:AT-hook motif nuclear-localized protein 17, partial [Cucurbita argyrosperma subsp. argyrosperma]
MLSKFHLSRHFTHPPPHQPEDEPTAAVPLPFKPLPESISAADDSTIEVVRRPRGRPPGSKNKPKPPLVITREPEPTMRPYVLEVPGGNDVVEAILRFCRQKNTALCVLNGSGTVANVSLHQPSATPSATVTFHGCFEILSISATVFPETMSFPVPNGFTISLAGHQGQIVGGMVAGALISAGTVFVIASSFNNPMYLRLPELDELKNSESGGGEVHSPHVSVAGDSSGHRPGQSRGRGQLVESHGMALMSCHAPSDVVWAPTARQPPPPPY